MHENRKSRALFAPYQGAPRSQCRNLECHLLAIWYTTGPLMREIIVQLTFSLVVVSRSMRICWLWFWAAVSTSCVSRSASFSCSHFTYEGLKTFKNTTSTHVECIELINSDILNPKRGFCKTVFQELIKIYWKVQIIFVSCLRRNTVNEWMNEWMNAVHARLRQPRLTRSCSTARRWFSVISSIFWRYSRSLSSHDSRSWKKKINCSYPAHNIMSAQLTAYVNNYQLEDIWKPDSVTAIL